MGLVYAQDAGTGVTQVDIVGSTGPTRVKLGNTFLDSNSFPPTSVAANTAETVEALGGTTLAIGNQVFVSLSGGPGTLTTAANTLTYVALKGVTTAKYYAVAFLGQAIAAAFTMSAAEKLNIVARNQDTAAHAFSGFFSAVAA